MDLHKIKILLHLIGSKSRENDQLYESEIDYFIDLGLIEPVDFHKGVYNPTQLGQVYLDQLKSLKRPGWLILMAVAL